MLKTQLLEFVGAVYRLNLDRGGHNQKSKKKRAKVSVFHDVGNP